MDGGALHGLAHRRPAVAISASLCAARPVGAHISTLRSHRAPQPHGDVRRERLARARPAGEHADGLAERQVQKRLLRGREQPPALLRGRRLSHRRTRGTSGRARVCSEPSRDVLRHVGLRVVQAPPSTRRAAPKRARGRRTSRAAVVRAPSRARRHRSIRFSSASEHRPPPPRARPAQARELPRAHSLATPSAISAPGRVHVPVAHGFLLQHSQHRRRQPLFGVRRLAEPRRERVAAVERRAAYPRERAEGVVANANARSRRRARRRLAARARARRRASPGSARRPFCRVSRSRLARASPRSSRPRPGTRAVSLRRPARRRRRTRPSRSAPRASRRWPCPPPAARRPPGTEASRPRPRAPSPRGWRSARTACPTSRRRASRPVSLRFRPSATLGMYPVIVITASFAPPAPPASFLVLRF